MRKIELLTGAAIAPMHRNFGESRNHSISHARNRAERRRYKVGAVGGGGPDSAMAANLSNRAAVVGLGREMIQQTYSQAVPGVAEGQTVTIPLRNVGLNKRLIVEVSGTLTPGAATTHQLTQLGIANLFSNITLTDLSNYQRINTAGWHLYLLASLRRQGAYGAAFVNDAPVNMGSTFPVQTAPFSFDAASTFRHFVEIPLAYSDQDLRGSIFAGVVNATWQLQLTINSGFWAATGADATLAGYQGNTATLGTLSGVTITVYQIYLDQLPYAGNTPVLPLLDLATAYMIQNTNATGMVANLDFPIQYANFRQFLSTFAIFNNAGVLNTGSDVAYWGIQAANLTFLRKVDPYLAALMARNVIGDDCPKGTYLFETRVQPINTIQTGNTQLVLNASAVTAGASVQLGYESMALMNQVTNAGSLAGG